jgi:hypothetical protein
MHHSPLLNHGNPTPGRLGNAGEARPKPRTVADMHLDFSSHRAAPSFSHRSSGPLRSIRTGNHPPCEVATPNQKVIDAGNRLCFAPAGGLAFSKLKNRITRSHRQHWSTVCAWDGGCVMDTCMNAPLPWFASVHSISGRQQMSCRARVPASSQARSLLGHVQMSFQDSSVSVVLRAD